MKLRPPRHVAVEAAAKVNVGWAVGPRRPDGYHDVRGLFQTISLTDRLEIEVEDEPGALVVVVPGHPALEDGSNLIHAAAEVLARAFAGEVEGLPATTVVVHKTIPVAAGLGGGSADAAAALVGLSVAWGARLPVKDLVGLGASVGSDVPGLLVGGLVAVSGRGELTTSVGSFDDGWLVLGVGAEHTSTAAVYGLFDEVGAEPSQELHHNDLEQAACELVPGLRDRVAAMRDAAGVAYVSGSGPTVVGVVADEQEAETVATTVHEAFADVLIARPSSWGVRLLLGT